MERYEEPLSTVDYSWLRMERPHNSMMITGIMTFDRTPDRERLKEGLRELADSFPRFRCRIRDGKAPVWEECEDFDCDEHYDERTLELPADRGVLRRAISDLVSTPLPFDRPLWRFHLLKNPVDGRAVLLSRIHHTMGDGFAMMYVMNTLTDPGPERTRQPPPPPRTSHQPSAWARLEHLTRAAAAAFENVRHTPREEIVNAAMAVGGDVWRLLALSNQPETRLRRPLGSRKQAAWSAPASVARVKATGKGLGGTINDVLMAAVAGSIGAYLREEGENGFDLRTVVPVNLRQNEAEMKRLGNHFGLVFLELPVHVDDPVRRFAITKERMDALKHSPEALLLWQILRVVGAAPAWVEELVIYILGMKSTAVMTNVPGPRERRYLAGEPIQTIMFWVPSSGNVGLGISVFSYAGSVRLGISVDTHLVREPQRILAHFPKELERLARAAGLEEQEPARPTTGA
ncbi:MAG: wax ester/triacylglycerol synthase family O-acyltransferase [Sandaracinaceae bacterium]